MPWQARAHPHAYVAWAPEKVRQGTLASGIGYLESIPQLHKSLKIRAQNLGSRKRWWKKNEEGFLLFIEVKKNEYIRTSTIEGTKKN